MILAVEILPNNKLGRAYFQCIEDYSKKSFEPFFRKKIEVDAKIITDGFKTYGSLKKQFKNLRQIKSENGENFKKLHIMIMNFKSWLRGFIINLTMDI